MTDAEKVKAYDDARRALAESGVAGFYDVFTSLADAITQLTLYAKLCSEPEKAHG